MTKLLKQVSILVIGVALFAQTACNKETNDGEDNTINLLTASPWKFSKATAGGFDVSALIDACIKDNLLIFSSSATTKTGKLNEGPTKCDPADPQEIDFTWVHDDSFDKLTITGVSGSVPILPGGSNEFNLISITATELVLSQNITFSGITQLVQVTLIH
jgi:hypothetical protein